MERCSIKNCTLSMGLSRLYKTNTMIRTFPNKVRTMIEARTYNFVLTPLSSISDWLEVSSVDDVVILSLKIDSFKKWKSDSSIGSRSSETPGTLSLLIGTLELDLCITWNGQLSKPSSKKTKSLRNSFERILSFLMCFWSLGNACTWQKWQIGPAQICSCKDYPKKVLKWRVTTPNTLLQVWGKITRSFRT